MKTEIMYDGVLTEKRVTILRNLTKLTIDNSLYTRVKDAENQLQIKQQYKDFMMSNNVKSHIYFDVVLGGVCYTMTAAGGYGMAIVGNPDNKLFEDKNDIYLLEAPEEITYLKSSFLSNKLKEYDKFITDNMTFGDVLCVIGESVCIDYSAFTGSTLWDELRVRRDLLAESTGTDAFMVYRTQDVIDLLSLVPDKPVSSCPIRQEYQEIILKAWKSFLMAETA